MKRTKFLIILLFIFVVNSLQAQLPYVDSLKTELTKDLHDTIRIVNLKLISWELKNSNYEKAIKYASEGLDLALSINDTAFIEELLNNKGVIYAMNSEFDKALEVFSKTKELNEQMNNINGLASSFNNIGLVSFYKGDMQSAVESYMSALDCYDKKNDEIGKASAYNNLGLIYENDKDYLKALHYQKLALDIRLNTNHKQLSMSYGNIGNLFYIQKELDSALVYFLKAEKLFKEENDIYSLGQLFGNIGKIYKQREEYKEALLYYNKGLKIEEEINDSRGKSINYLNIAEVYEYTDRYDSSIFFAEKGVSIAEEIGAKDIMRQAYNVLHKTYYFKKDFEKAYYYSNLYSAIRDSIMNESNQDKIAELETAHQTHRKEQEIELLKKESDLKELELDRNQLVIYGILTLLIIGAVFSYFVYKNYKQKNKAFDLLKIKNQEILQQKDVIEFKNVRIGESLNYAKRIQLALLPDDKNIVDLIPNNFIFYKPKDVVSGDFYWVHEYDNKMLIAAVDCTGHGVPGAFMSIIGNNGLNSSVQASISLNAAEILNKLDVHVKESLHQDSVGLKDGMDISLCMLDYENDELQFAGAHNPLYLIKNNELTEIKGDKLAVGDAKGDFTNNVLKISDYDSLYIFTDGYADQFGGEKGRKFNYKRFRNTIREISSLEMKAQKNELDLRLTQWMQNEEQIDDICVIGVKLS